MGTQSPPKRLHVNRLAAAWRPVVQSTARPSPVPADGASRRKENALTELDDAEAGGSLRKDPVLGVDEANGSTIVRLGGELDLYNANEVRDALFNSCDGGAERIVVDLSEVEFLDSTALGVLIEARTRLKNKKAFLLASPGLETRRALEISGLDRHFTVFDTLQEALEAQV